MFKRTGTAQPYVAPRYSNRSAHFNNSSVDRIPTSQRAVGGFDGVQQGLSCREPMRPRDEFALERTIAGSYHEDDYYV